MQKPDIVLLGHTGFIGKQIYARVKGKGHNVKGLSLPHFNLLNKGNSKKLSSHLNKNTILIITVVINRELGDNLQTMQDNIKMIANIAEALEEKPIKKCVYLSSADVYGRPEKLPITEETPIAPRTYYAVAKYSCERLLQAAAEKSNFPLLVLRYNGVFGPGQINIGYGPNFFIKSIIEDGVVRLWGDGRELRDVVYVKDLAKIITQLSLNKTTGIYNVANGKSRSFLGMVELLKKISSKKFKVIRRKRTSPAFDQVFNIDKLSKVLPRLSFTPFKEALSDTFHSY